MFSGVDGLALGVQLAVPGATVAWHAETDKDACRVLERHWPGVPNLGDVEKIDWAGIERVDLLVAGFPCQGFSQAGKGRGHDDARSGLWREVVRCVRALGPDLVFLENVRALLRRGFDRVAADLADCGYRFAWSSVSSASAGAPHRRERVFVLAAPDDDRERRENEGLEQRQRPQHGSTSSRGTAPDHDSERVQEGGARPSGRARVVGLPAHASRSRLAWAPGEEEEDDRHAARRGANDPLANGDGGRLSRDAESRPGAWIEPRDDADGRDEGDFACDCGHVSLIDIERDPCPQCGEFRGGHVTYATGAGRERLDGRETGGSSGPAAPEPEYDGGVPARFLPAVRRWERIFGWQVPPMSVRSQNGPVLNPDFSEWMMGLVPGWTAGPSRTTRLRLIGNSVQPQVARHAFVGLLERLEEHR